jgi:DNA mismatch endonuclease (patch repair protein)
MGADSKIYSRDKRSPIPKNEVTSKVMSAIRAKDTKPELLLRRSLWQKGIRGYRLHWKKVPGRPDIAFPGKKIAIFINGCYWHRCPYCDLPLPKNNAAFWSNKFSKNTERDKAKVEALRKLGWDTVTIWECELKTNIKSQIEKIEKLIYGKKKS